MKTIKLNVTISDETVNNIIMLSIPAMNWWCNNIKYISRNSRDREPTWGSFEGKDVVPRFMLNMEVNKVMIQDKYTEKFYPISRKIIIKGAKQFFTDRIFEVRALPNIDEKTAHEIMQYALFGHVKYDTHGRKIS